MNPSSADLSIVTLVMNASVVVQCVLGILVLASLMSWATIFSKAIVLSRTARQTEEFEKRFWSGADLAKLFESATSRHDRTGAEERIFVAGMAEFVKLAGKAEVEQLSGVRRGMTAAFQREVDDLERGLPLLASIGSVSPYIGLFGTVWGIMNAFTGLSTLDNVSLAVVAPGIAEALVATAIGLFAAIPAPAAYNYFDNRLERPEGQTIMALKSLQTRKKRRMMSDMNVVPYIDVMLVLVVILMVAAPFVNPSVINLPSVSKASAAPANPVEVVVHADGHSRLKSKTGSGPLT